MNGVFAQSETFDYTGAIQTYTVPDGVTSILIEAWGAQGGSSVGFDGNSAAGGLGGFSTGELAVVPGQILTIYVGGEGDPLGPGGFNGGGQAGTLYGAGGGGASDVRVVPNTFVDRQLVAGGGGGGSYGTFGNQGGDGGGLNGLSGENGPGFIGGGGASQGAGGSAGCCYGSASPGLFGLGAGPGDYHNAGGGGGWYGGGSGAGYAGAGGGSSYIDDVTDATTTSGLRSGNGQVIITVACDPLTITVSDIALCDEEELTLDCASDNGGGLSWDFGVSNGVPFIPASTGILTYTVTSDNDGDCWASIDIEVFELPAVMAGVDIVEICVGDPVVFSESGDADTYTWDPVDVTSGDPYFPVEGIATYTLTGIDGVTGCENTDLVEVTANELPIITAGPDIEVCIGDEVVLTGIGAGVDGTYSWDGGIINDTPFAPILTSSYIVLGTDDTGCENTYTVEVTVFELPPIEAGVDDTICFGQSALLSAEGLADPDEYSWSDDVINDALFTPELTNLYYLFGTDDNGCSNSDSVQIIVRALPVIYAGDNQTVCLGNEVELNGSGAGVDGIYLWSEGVLDGLPFSPIATTEYILLGTDENGCENTDTVAVEIYTLPLINAGIDLFVCIGDPAVLTATGAGPDGVYIWEDGIVNDLIFEPSSTAIYVVLGLDENDCENRDSVLVTVYLLPLVIAGEDLAICEGDEVELNGEGAGEDGTYFWNQDIADGESFVPDSSSDFILLGLDANGCENSDTISITLLAIPMIYGGLDQRVCLEDDIILTVVDKEIDVIYEWDNGVEDGVSFSGYSESQTIYTVMAINSDACENTDEVLVDVINCDTVLIFPSGFSPNNDGVNDFLTFKGINADQSMYLAVYNEWGMKLFESSDYQNDWDGRNQLGTSIGKNTELPVGTYYYILEYGENNVVKNYLYIER